MIVGSHPFSLLAFHLSSVFVFPHQPLYPATSAPLSLLPTTGAPLPLCRSPYHPCHRFQSSDELSTTCVRGWRGSWGGSGTSAARHVLLGDSTRVEGWRSDAGEWRREAGSNPGQLSFPTIAGQLPSLTTAAAPPPHLRLSTIARRSSPARQLVVAVASPSTELSRSSTVARRQLDSAAVAGRRLW